MKTIVIGLLGTSLDRRGVGAKRWDRWRPTLSLCQHDDLLVDRLELLHAPDHQTLVAQLTEDIARVSPETEVVPYPITFQDPWDFESVYAHLLDFARAYPFQPDEHEYLVHITTGTHVAQICLYLLTEAGYLPGRLLQTSPASRTSDLPGQYQIIDLDLSKYDQIASRFEREHQEGAAYLKGGIQTRNPAFNSMIEQLEKVSIRSREPILLTGPTGAGKTQLAQRVFALKKQRSQLSGRLVTVNCATLRGDQAMSALFGHKKGAFTGALSSRTGLLREANKGLLFLDEVGELGLDEQAMLLKAIEDKSFLPYGSDQEVHSDFQLIAGTNRDLQARVTEGKFREDLLARIDLWSYELPSLRARLEDLEPNIQYELESFCQKTGTLVGFNRDARERFLRFAHSPEALWSANFRDLNASLTRMGTLATGGRITEAVVAEEITRLKKKWQMKKPNDPAQVLADLLSPEQLQAIDYLEQVRLSAVIQACQNARSMAEAGRRLFNVSRTQKTSQNDSHRVKQILDKYAISFSQIRSL